MGRSDAEWRAFQAKTAARRAPPEAPKPLVPYDPRSIVLGRNRQVGAPILLSERARLEHAHVIGTTGGGKTKFLEACIRQDIQAGRGVCVVDPHGDHPDSLYRSLLGWLHHHGYTAGGENARPIHLIDPNASSHTVGFNPLARPDVETDLSVVAGVALEAFERVWGGEDTQTKPTIRRVLRATFVALAELGLTLSEAELLYDVDDPHGVRAWAAAHVRDPYARTELKRLHDLSCDPSMRRDFRVEVVGPINRIAEFVSAPAIRAIIGQSENVLDLREALDDGHIILVNLSGGRHVYERDADLLGRLLTRFLLFHAKRRHNPERPFFVYLDECHRYLSGDLENILAEVRKYGVGLVLAHQWLAQLEAQDENMLAAVRSATNLKAVFRLKDPEEAEDLAHMVVPLDLEMPVRALVKPTVIGHRLVRLRSESRGASIGATRSRAESIGQSEGETHSFTSSFSETSSYGTSVTESDSVSIGESTSRAASSGLGIADALSNGVSSSSGVSEGVSHSAGSGTATGTSTGETMLPTEDGFFGTSDPTVVAVSHGESSMSHSSDTSGTNSAISSARGMSNGRSQSHSRTSGATIGSGTSKARTTGVSHGTSESHATTVGFSEGVAFSRGRSRANTTGVAESRGTTLTEGTQEAFEPLYEELPSAVHSKENMLYMAAQTLRNLTTGMAFINFVDATGMHPGLLRVPDVHSFAPEPAVFDELRRHVLSHSVAATPEARAAERIRDREQRLLAAAKRALEPPEPQRPAEYRVQKSRPAPEPKSPAGYRTKKERPAKEKDEMPPKKP
jgi:hypothetical protein